jgi:hypothetical protein
MATGGSSSSTDTDKLDDSNLSPDRTTAIEFELLKKKLAVMEKKLGKYEKDSEFKMAHEKKESKFKTMVRDLEPQEVAGLMFNPKDGIDPFRMEFASEEKLMIERYIDKHLVTTPELSDDLMLYIKTIPSQKAKALGLLSTMRALGLIFTTIHAAAVAEDTVECQRALNIALVFTSMEMSKNGLDLRNVSREVLDAPKVRSEAEKPFISTLEDEEYLERKRKRDDLVAALRPAHRSPKKKKRGWTPGGGGGGGNSGNSSQKATYVEDKSGGGAPGQSNGRPAGLGGKKKAFKS